MHWTAGLRFVFMLNTAGPPPVMCIVSLARSPMQKCRHCRTENEDNASACSECGLSLSPSPVVKLLTRVAAHLQAGLRTLTLVERVPSAAKCFVGAFWLTCLFGVGVNLVTYLVTRGAYNGDGFEVVGFPFVFRRLGGIAGLYEFRVLALFADLLTILATSVAVGFAFSRWCCHRYSHDTDTQIG